MSTFKIDLSRNPRSQSFDLSRFMRWDQSAGMYDPLDSQIIDRIQNLPQEGVFPLEDGENIPDLISWLIYRDHQYWWVLSIYNGYLDFTSIPERAVIRYPSIASLVGLFSTLRAELFQDERAALT